MTLMNPEIIERLNNIEANVRNNAVPYAVTTNNGNVYSGTFGLTNLTDGKTIRLKCNANSNGAVSVNPDGLGAIPVINTNGTPISNWTLNGIYTLVYNSTTQSFMLQGEGRDRSLEEALKRQVADLTALADIYDTVTGAQSVFYDRMDGTNDHSCGKIDFFYTNTLFAYDSGVYSVKVRNTNGISVGQVVSIMDKTNYETKTISAIDVSANEITFTTALVHSYGVNTAVCRSSMIRNTADTVLESGGWRYNVNVDGLPGLRQSVVADAVNELRSYGGRRCTVLSNGWIIAVSGDSKHFYQISKDGGYSWSTLLIRNHDSAVNVAVASYGMMLYVLRTGGTSNRVVVHKYNVLTGQGSDVEIPSSATTVSVGCAIAVDPTNGNLYATWTTKSLSYHLSPNICHSTSVDGGTTWTGVDGSGYFDYITTISNTSVSMLHPCITVLNNKPVIVWRYYNTTDGYYKILMARWTGTVWSNVEIVSSLYTQSNPSLIVSPNGQLHVVWNGKDSASPLYMNIMYSRSTDSGNTWSSVTKVTTQASINYEFPTITCDKNNKLYAIWHANDTVSSTNLFSASAIDGVWSSFSNITKKSSGAQRYASAAVYSNFSEPMFVWIDSIYDRILFSGYSSQCIKDHNPMPSVISNSSMDISGCGRKIVKLSNEWLVTVHINSEKPTFMVSKDAGYSWHALTTIDHTYNTGRKISIDSYGTTVYCTCSTSDVALCVIGFDATNVASTISYSTHGITTLQTIPSADIDSSYILCNKANGDIHVVWTAKSALTPNSNNLRHIKGSNVGTPTELWGGEDGSVGYEVLSSYNTSGYDLIDPILVISDNKPHIIASYAGSSNTTSRSLIHYYTTSNIWHTSDIIAGSTYEQLTPSATVDSNGNICLTWAGDSSTYANRQLWFSKLSVGSTIWSTPVCVISAENYISNMSDVSNPSITYDPSGKLFIVYQAISSYGETYDQILYQVSYDGGQTWSTMIKISNGGTAAHLNPHTLLSVETHYLKPLVYWNNPTANQLRFICGNSDSYSLSNCVISDSGNAFGTDVTSGRKLVYLENGWFVAAIFDGSSIINLYVSKDKGVTWSRLCYIDSSLSSYAICSYKNIVYVVCARYSVMYFYAIDAETVADINMRGFYISTIGTQTDAVQPFVTCEPVTGKIHIAWCAKTASYTDRYALMYSASDNGKTWRPVTVLASSSIANHNCAYPVIALSDGLPCVIYSMIGAATSLISYIKLTGHDGSDYTWTGNTIYTSDTLDYQQTSLAVSTSPTDNSIHIVWSGADSGDTTTNIRYAKSTDGGITWSVPSKISPASVVGYEQPSLCINKDGAIYVLFVIKTGSKNICSLVFTTSWSSMNILTSDTMAATMPQTCDNFYNFSKPIFIYRDVTNNNNKFSGKFTISENTGTDIIRLNIIPALGQTDEIISWCKFSRADAGFAIDAVCSIVATNGNEVYNAMIKSINELPDYINELQVLYHSNIAGQRVSLEIRLFHFTHGYVNQLGIYGKCDDRLLLTDFATTCTIEDEATNKVSGSTGSLRVTSTSTSFNICIPLLDRIDPTKYYMISAYYKNGNAQNGVHLGFASIGATEPVDISSTNVTSTTEFTRVMIRIKPTNIENASLLKLFLISGYGTVDDYAYVDCVMLNEITADEYDFSSNTELMRTYPYVESSKSFGDVLYISGAVN